MIVVKVGGSLYDSPALGPALRAFLASLAPTEVLLVPGGGGVADAVRELDRTHGIGEEAAHWVALRALSVTAAFLGAISGPLPPTPSPKKGGGEEQKGGGEDQRPRYIVRGQRVAADKVQRAKELRRDMTPAERIIWELIRANRLGHQFRRQRVIDGYIVDFYCHAVALVIEVDGAVHDDQAEYDARRTSVFETRGIRVIRFRNEEVLDNANAVTARIIAACAERGQEPLPPTPSPKKGGGAEPEAGAPASVLSPSLPRGGVGEGSLRVLDCFTFAREDELRPGALPHTWSVTTDSIAARAAVVFRAERLVLLKSVDIPAGTPWDEAAANGWVDAHFPRIAPTLPCPVEVVNFRLRLDTPT